VQNKFTKTEIIALLAVSIIPWLPVLFTSFLNDDYQIIGFHANIDASSLLKPFYTPDISGYYWRPLGNFLHVLTLYVTGFSAFAFRAGNFALYALCSLQLAFLMLKAGISKRIALYSAALFALLPSHGFIIGWIAGKGEFLLFILLLLFAQYYIIPPKGNNGRKQFFYAYLFFAAALLVKELAFAVVFVPAARFALKGHYTKERLYKCLKHTLAFLAGIALYLFIRGAVAGGTPFSSPHFHDKNPLNYIKNYLIYLIISFVPPELPEKLLSAGMLTATAVLLAAVSLILFVIYKKRIEIRKEQKIILAGAAWFTVFIIPVLPTLMRWYPFTASAGLILIIAALIPAAAGGARRAGYVFFIPLIILLAGYDFYMSMNWRRAGEKMDSIMAQIPKTENIFTADSVLTLATPDKLNDIPVMKLGVQQTFEYALGGRREVFAPLRAEIETPAAKTRLISVNGNKIKLELTGGAFLPEGGRLAGKKRGELSDEIDGVKIKISAVSSGNSLISYAELEIAERYKNYLWLYYDGEKFSTVKAVSAN
jgi:hypothetical protein